MQSFPLFKFFKNKTKRFDFFFFQILCFHAFFLKETDGKQKKENFAM